jgi:hypothetical protein
MIQAILIWLYSNLLRLYPAAFYRQFADDMTDTFRSVLQDQPPVLAGLREIAMLPAAILHEHQRANTTWHMMAFLLLPALLACFVLLLRPLSRFYLSYNLWLLFAGLIFALIGLGWLLERRLTVLALPGLGLLLFIGLRLLTTLPGYTVPLLAQITVPLVLLVAALGLLTVQHRLRWPVWLPPVIALPAAGLVMSLVVIAINEAFNWPARDILRGFVLGALLPAGTLSLLILAGLLFARWFGSKAVLLLVGYLFFDLLGLTATLPRPELQQGMGMFYALLFLLVIPLLRLKLPRYERLTVLLPVALAYGLLFLMTGMIGEVDATFLLYRTNELIQTLLALWIAIQVYGRLERAAPAPDSPRLKMQQIAQS